MAEEKDPRAKWRQLPERVHPDELTADVDTPGYDTSLAADADLQQREARTVLERGGLG